MSISAGTPVTLQDLNKRNSEFWREQLRLRDRHISVPGVAEAATFFVCSEAARSLPVRWHTPFDQALAEAAAAREIFLRELARKAGKAHQADALQQLIRKIVEEDPKLTEPRLIHLLAGERGAGVVTSIDGPNEGHAGERQIHWVDDKERQRVIPLSCLKDRLYRAKKSARTS